MAITYTWKVTSMKVTNTENLNDIVIQTYWKKIGVDEQGNEGIFNGATPFTVPTENLEKFIPFEELTEDVVIGWIQDAIIINEDIIDDQIQKQIDSKKNVVREKPLPW